MSSPASSIARAAGGLDGGRLTEIRGQEEYERLRPLSYSKAHVILIAFAVDTPDSLDNVSQKVSRAKLSHRVSSNAADRTQWIEEVRQICGKAIPVILVACKADLRDKAMASGTFTPDRYIDTTTVSSTLSSREASASG